MPYKYLENIAMADIAFEASGRTLDELLESCALAITNTMVKDLKKIENIQKKEIKVEAENPEFLLHKFLEEIVFLKDAEKLLFGKFNVRTEKKGKKMIATIQAWGEKLNMKKHELLDDIKAVTWHDFKVQKTGKEWKALVILDV